MRKLVWMAEARQTDEWARAFAVVATIGNIFADRSSRIDIRKFLPPHLNRPTPEPEPDPREVKIVWSALRKLITGGKVKGG